MEGNRPIALITGASRGIGRAIAQRMAGEGYDLVLTCVNNEEILRKIVAELEESYGIKCLAYKISNEDSAQISQLISKLPRLDVLVNNAGVAHVGLLMDMTDDEWRHLMGVNLDGVFYYCREAVKKMLSNGQGNIINISSVWGNVGASMEVAYSASKGAVNSFTKALAKELAPNGITVNAIACGLIDTDMNKCFSEEDLAAVIDEIPADRIGQPQEVAELVSSIINAPQYMTGQVITMDGGWT